MSATKRASRKPTKSRVKTAASAKSPKEKKTKKTKKTKATLPNKKPAAKRAQGGAAPGKAAAKKPTAKSAGSKKASSKAVAAKKKTTAKKTTTRTNAPKGTAAKKAAAKKAATTKARLSRRDGSGHMDAKYAAGLRALSKKSRNEGESAFVRGGRSRDDLAQQLGEEVVDKMTTGEDEGEDIANQDVEEELGGPFVVTSSGTEFADGTDLSNPKGSKREPFPRT